MSIVRLTRSRLGVAKRAFTTRRVPVKDMRTLIAGDVRPRAGDLVLATVAKVGMHQRIELTSGRRARLSPGDQIIVCFGNRYAPDQFEALVGEDLSGCDLVAAGGIAAREICRHERMLEPTRILPVALVGNASGRQLNVADYAINFEEGSPIPVVIVAGTSMNSGKTVTAASLVRGLASANLKVAGIKATGTGSGNDLWVMSDLGAHRVLDFTDAGFASTYMAPSDEIEKAVFGLIGHAASKCEVAVVEIADGLQHVETATLLSSERLRRRVCGVVFAAHDALGAQAGVEALARQSYEVLAISGLIARSPLAMREAGRATGLTVLSPFDLQAGALNEVILMDRDARAAEEAPDKKAAHTSGAAANGGLAVGQLEPGGAVAQLMRGGRQIVRSMQDIQADVFRSLGANGPPLFDEDTEDWRASG